MSDRYRVGPMVWTTELVCLAPPHTLLGGGLDSLEAQTNIDKTINRCMSGLIGRYGWCEPVQISWSPPVTLDSGVWSYLTVLARKARSPNAISEGA